MGRAIRQRRWREWSELWQAFGLRPQRRQVGALALLLLGSTGLQLLNPQIMRQFVDSATHGAPDRRRETPTQPSARRRDTPTTTADH